MVRRLGYTVELALLTIARATLIRPPDPATTEAVAEAREILTGLGAVPLLKLLDDAAAGPGAEVAGPALGSREGSPKPSTSGSPSRS
jgi:hypothetical protein